MGTDEIVKVIAELYASLEAAVVALGASPWLVLVVFALCCLDAVFPVGCIAVNMSAGATGFPLQRFLLIAALAGVLWANIAAGMGIVASQIFDDHPLVAVVIGVAIGICCGLLLDWIIQRRRPRRLAQTQAQQPEPPQSRQENMP